MIAGITSFRDQGIDSLAIGLFGARRRHDAAAQLAHGLLETLGIFRDSRRRNVFEGDAAILRFIVMAAQAVLLDGGQMGVGRGRRRLGCTNNTGEAEDSNQGD